MKTILVVDDEALIRILVKKELDKLGFNVITAIDGETGWDQLNQDRPDLVITDLNMPSMGGLDLLERIRNSEEFSLLPVLCITGANESELKQRAVTLGATGWIQKPFNPSSWGTTLSKILH
ncbi:MAG: response regulator [Gammaproteobacteria bacterium]|jgi:two-component system chemotaxis response regulator CheY|nr:response regulator [Gammaproteobacteria bacterium]MBT3489145.1 response regulator [Gammaproteobacteria bacterium]MBT3719358.1 response regulator [Gammaproteobacteria bacterium]MBT3845344.1 response regulator [Gammaproteobacteria bacterium]MBT3892494.1 response regulator [Gammaproteobacteria bacterium]